MKALLLGLVMSLGASQISAQWDSTLAAECPYCGADPALMEASGLVSHGPFAFGKGGSRAAQELVPTAQIFWGESAHFRLGYGAGPVKVPSKDLKALRVELERLQLTLPAVKPKTKVLDPWLRVHLLAQRCEELYSRFMEVMQVSQQDFPDAGRVWRIGTPYWGEGPYLGQQDKFEVLVLSNPDEQVDYLSAEYGLQIKHTQLWNSIERGALILVTNLIQDSLQSDLKLHGHLAFNLIHNFLNGFKSYSYDTPLWIQEGLGHYFERQLSTRYNSFSRSEGGIPLERSSKKWLQEVQGLIKSKDAPRLAELMALKSFSDFTLEQHYTTWSMVAFLVETKPQAFADLNKRIHGRKTADGNGDGSNIDDAFREAFKETVGLSYGGFDRAWAEWALLQEP